MAKETPIQKAIRLVGGVVRAAEICETSRQTVYKWKKGLHPVTWEAAQALDEATQGAVTKEELRPDVYAAA